MRFRALRSLLGILLIAALSRSFAQAPVPGIHQNPTDSINDRVTKEPESAASPKLLVRWQNGQLTVTAHRTTLHSVLMAIAERTGLVVEVSPGADTGLVYVDLGPGTMHDVLAALLNDDSSNYILTGSPGKPGHVDRLELSTALHAQVVAASQPAAPPPQPELYRGGFSAASDSESNEPAPGASAVVPEAPVNTALTPVQSTIDPSIQNYQQTYAEMLKSGKSRADILSELQKQQIRDLDAQAAAQAAAQPPQQ